MYSHDICHMMETGIHLTAENTQRERGYVETSEGCEATLPYVRHWYFQDPAKPHRWTATLSVWGRTLEILSGFRVSSLASSNVGFGRAWNGKGNIVYEFEAIAPEHAFNAIYDDMPLSGLWPWPRAKREGDGDDRKSLLQLPMHDPQAVIHVDA
jgi:hypothetical protein